MDAVDALICYGFRIVSPEDGKKYYMIQKPLYIKPEDQQSVDALLKEVFGNSKIYELIINIKGVTKINEITEDI